MPILVGVTPTGIFTKLQYDDEAETLSAPFCNVRISTKKLLEVLLGSAILNHRTTLQRPDELPFLLEVGFLRQSYRIRISDITNALELMISPRG
jgi:hypothetical protein